MGENPLVCWIQPLQDSVPLSLQANLMSCRRFSLVYSCRSDTFHCYAEKNSAIGLRNGDYGGRQTLLNCWLMLNQCTRTARLKLMPYKTMTETGCPACSWSCCSRSFKTPWRLTRNVKRCWVLYGLKVAWLWRTPQLLIAAHRVTLPLCWPGTFTMAHWPDMF